MYLNLPLVLRLFCEIGTSVLALMKGVFSYNTLISLYILMYWAGLQFKSSKLDSALQDLLALWPFWFCQEKWSQICLFKLTGESLNVGKNKRIIIILRDICIPCSLLSIWTVSSVRWLWLVLDVGCSGVSVSFLNGTNSYRSIHASVCTCDCKFFSSTILTSFKFWFFRSKSGCKARKHQEKHEPLIMNKICHDLMSYSS